VAILKEGEAGVPVAQILGKHEIGHATFYKWKSQYSGASIAELRRLRELRPCYRVTGRDLGPVALRRNGDTELVANLAKTHIRYAVAFGYRAYRICPDFPKEDFALEGGFNPRHRRSRSFDTARG
jgi:hypothetical protein